MRQAVEYKIYHRAYDLLCLDLSSSAILLRHDPDRATLPTPIFTMGFKTRNEFPRLHSRVQGAQSPITSTISPF